MKINSKQISLIALFLALCVVVPLLFHAIGLGKMFLPMLLPMLLAAFIMGFPAAIIVGVLGPWTSALTTGMPPLFPTAVVMSVEGFITTALASYLFDKRHVSYWKCLIIALVANRIVQIFMLLLILPLFGLPPRIITIADLIYSLPGILLNFIFTPVILNYLWKLKIVERKS